jgi:hypothetical protein
VPSDITFALQRGDLRSFVTAIQYGTELNPWDAWFARLEASRVGKSVYIWDDGLKKAPFCVLIRHVFLWLQTFRGGIYFKKPEFASFVGACLELQDAPMTTLLERIPAAWEKFYLCESAK